ncbi:hypothetical protein J6590_106086, partial [Homalodisca vitripennis]
MDKRRFAFVLELCHGEAVLCGPSREKREDKNKVNEAWIRASKQINPSVPELKKIKDSLILTFRTKVLRQLQ